LFWNKNLETVRSIYIHFPFCRHLCNYCDFYKRETPQGPNDTELNRYYSLLQESFTKISPHMAENQIEVKDIETLYIGGGTPSLGGVGYIDQLNKFMADNGISFSSSYEWTVECNPDSVNDTFVDRAKELAVNRFSLGIQSLDSTLFKYLDRVHSLEESFSALDCFSKKDVNFTADLMLGLPRPEGHSRDIKFEIEKIVNSGANHISLYILKVPNTYKYYDLLPGEDEVADEYMLVANTLKEMGFEHYEVSNFSRPGFESKHNMKYWTHDSVLALGPSATGFFSTNNFRFKWKPESADYSWEMLSENQVKLESLFLAVRTKDGIKIEDYFPENEADEIFLNWKKNGLATIENGYFKLTSAGFLIEDSLINELFSKNLL
jgi:oxygen-independent coproporphyrinogen-3 oxidase